MKVNYFKKIILFFTYRNKIIGLQKDLKLQFNVRIDNILRCYTVLNIPEDVFDDPYNFRRSDIETLSRPYIREFYGKVSDFLNKNGLTELYEVYDLEKVDKYSYLLIFGYSLINTKRFMNTVIYYWIPIIFLISSVFSLYYIFK